MKFMPKMNLGLIIFTLLAVFGMLYLFQVNDVSTKGYELRKLERRLIELRDTTARLELEASELKSIQNIESQTRGLNMVPSQGMNYVKDGDYALKQ